MSSYELMLVFARNTVGNLRSLSCLELFRLRALMRKAGFTIRCLIFVQCNTLLRRDSCGYTRYTFETNVDQHVPDWVNPGPLQLPDWAELWRRWGIACAHRLFTVAPDNVKLTKVSSVGGIISC